MRAARCVRYRGRVPTLAVRVMAVTALLLAARSSAARPGGASEDRAARAALREHVGWILQRPKPAERLFVEGYFARSLVAAYDVLHGSAADSALARTALARAVAFADSLVATQSESGYWHLGYAGGWVADMGAALGVFAALEPYADSLRLGRYTAAAERFAAALERDGLVLPDGAIGVGWTMGDRPERVLREWRSGFGWSDDPYVVATALAGIEVHAWLFRRTGDVRYRERASRALDWTLAHLGPDGRLPQFARSDGDFATAAYVEEGWMAADLMLADEPLRSRLCAALPKHVDWLVATQQRDGTWGDAVTGERSRTPAIADFLLWYESRCETRKGLHPALERARGALVHHEHTWAHGLEGKGDYLEVLHALVGRPLAALARGRPVP